MRQNKDSRTRISRACPNTGLLLASTCQPKEVHNLEQSPLKESPSLSNLSLNQHYYGL